MKKWRKIIVLNLGIILPFIMISSLALASQSKPNPTLNRENLRNLLLSQGYIEIPLQRAANESILLIDGTFGNKQNQSFILDTGAALTTIDPKIVKEQGYKLRNKSLKTGGADSHRHHSYEVLVPTLQFTNFTSHDNIAYTEDESFIKVDSKPIAGKIGLDFLRNHSAILDIANQHLYLKPNSDQLTAAKIAVYQRHLLNAGYQQIQLERSPSRHQTLKITINNTNPVLFLLDSGMPHTAISLDYARTLGLKINSQPIHGKGSGGGKLEIYKTNINEFSVESLQWGMHEIRAIDFKYVQVGVPLSGVVGIDWLQSNRAIMDLENDRIFVKI